MLSVDDIVEEIAPVNGRVRVGEIIIVRESHRRSVELIQLNPHSLEPFRRGELAHYKHFRITENRCKLFNKSKFEKNARFDSAMLFAKFI